MCVCSVVYVCVCCVCVCVCVLCVCVCACMRAVCADFSGLNAITEASCTSTSSDTNMNAINICINKHVIM